MNSTQSLSKTNNKAINLKGSKMAIHYETLSESKRNINKKLKDNGMINNIGNSKDMNSFPILRANGSQMDKKIHLKGLNPHYKNFIMKKRRRMVHHGNSMLKHLKTSTESNSQTLLRKTHHADSKFGLTVVLNPNEAEYGNALKNSFTGFKALVHTPYDFAEVDAIGMAIDKNIQSYIGIRGYHSWTTDAANGMLFLQKRCLSRSDDITKYPFITLDVFANYTKKGCILECHANLYFEKCKCLPYHYPDFTHAWLKNTTACDYNGLKCLSTVKGK